MKPLRHNPAATNAPSQQPSVFTRLHKATRIFLAMAITATFVACHDHDHDHGHGDSGEGSGFITVDSADKMIGSYLASVNYPKNDSNLCALSFNADTLRAYLSNPQVKDVKIMFAHTLEYINNGGQNQPCGYKHGELTLILAAYDANGNYVLYNSPTGVAEVMDHAIPCPAACPNGTAAAAIIPPVNTHPKDR